MNAAAGSPVGEGVGERAARDPRELRCTFTFICHPGKTHNHRSRGDTPWEAQTESFDVCGVESFDVCGVAA